MDHVPDLPTSGKSLGESTSATEAVKLNINNIRENDKRTGRRSICSDSGLDLEKCYKEPKETAWVTWQ